VVILWGREAGDERRGEIRYLSNKRHMSTHHLIYNFYYIYLIYNPYFFMRDIVNGKGLDCPYL
jgi:hypothetical protein